MRLCKRPPSHVFSSYSNVKALQICISASSQPDHACLQDCLSFGKPLLIENIEEELDPVLDPVLERRYVKKGRGYTVALADKEVSLPCHTCLQSAYMHCRIYLSQIREQQICFVSIWKSSHHLPCVDIAISTISAGSMPQCTLLPASLY